MARRVIMAELKMADRGLWGVIDGALRSMVKATIEVDDFHVTTFHEYRMEDDKVTATYSRPNDIVGHVVFDGTLEDLLVAWSDDETIFEEN